MEQQGRLGGTLSEIALRAFRSPVSGLATMLASISHQTGSRLVAVYLETPETDAVELLASAGPEAAQLGPPGRLGAQTTELVRTVISDLAASDGPSGLMRETAPWSLHRSVTSVSIALDGSNVCLLTFAGEDPIDPNAFSSDTAAVGLLAQMVVLKREVERLGQELHDVRQDRSLLAAGLHHDLKGPLTSIMGAARTLIAREDELDPELRNTLMASIASQSERLNRMLSETLETQASDPNAPVRSLSTSVKDICERVAEDATSARPGSIIVESPDLRWVTDPDRLERALVNLVDNALKYAPSGTAVYLIVEEEGDKLVITVADNGPGVSPDVLPGLFSAYATDPSRPDGTGLGLHSVRLLVDELGGRVGYARHSGWTRFAITLPRRGQTE